MTIALNGKQVSVTPSESQVSVVSDDALGNVTATASSDTSDNTLTMSGLTAKSIIISSGTDESGQPTIVAADASSTKLGSMPVKYTASFFTAGGNDIQSAKDIQYGATITAPTDPTRAGYIFGGWYSDEACTTLWDFSTNTVTADTVLYAKWTEDPDYYKTVTFSANGCDDQVIFVPAGTQFTADKLPGANDFNGVEIAWDADAVNALIANGVTDNVTITGMAVPKGSGEALVFADPTLTNGTLSFSLTNKTVADFGLTIIAAAYDASGRMLGTASLAPTAEANATQTLTVDFSGFGTLDHVKLFMFYDNQTCAPLCESVSAAGANS